MATDLQQMASEIADALVDAIDGCDAVHLEDHGPEISVEMADGRRCHLIVQAHWEDD